jgi:hypothetical protein
MMGESRSSEVFLLQRLHDKSRWTLVNNSFNCQDHASEGLFSQNTSCLNCGVHSPSVDLAVKSALSQCFALKASLYFSEQIADYFQKNITNHFV